MLLTASTASGESGGGASMFGKDVKTWLASDKARSGRPPIDFLDIGILALLDKRPFHSAYSIAEAPCVSHSTLLSHLRESRAMKNFHLRWIAHELTTRLSQIRMETCREILPLLKAHEKDKSQKLMTGDES
jgi:hypothetical protein